MTPYDSTSERAKGRFTSTEAAAAVGMVPITLQSWLKKGWLDPILPQKVAEGKWSHFTAGNLHVLQVAKEFSRIVHPRIALAAAGECYAGIMLYRTESRKRSRFVGLALFDVCGVRYAAASAAASIGEFQSKDWTLPYSFWLVEGKVRASDVFSPPEKPFTYLLVDLEALPPPTVKESTK